MDGQYKLKSPYLNGIGEINMPKSKCPKCENETFEIQHNSPTGSKYRVAFVQCSKCGTVVGVTDENDTAALLGPIYKQLGIRSPV